MGSGEGRAGRGTAEQLPTISDAEKQWRASAHHRDALAARESADKPVARKDERADEIALLVKELHLCAGELPARDRAQHLERAGGRRGAVAAGRALLRLRQIDRALV